MALRIEDYALIGDTRTAALVGRNGSIDWLCWPRFDSDACFAALLGDEKNGHWLVAPKNLDKNVEAKVTRRYRPGTLILETRFETPDGAATLIDFMSQRGTGSRIIRIVRGEKGRVSMHSQLVMRFGYGAVVPWVTRLDDYTIRAIAGPDMILLRSEVKMRGENMRTVGDFTVSAGETVSFVMTYATSHDEPPEATDPEADLEAVEQGWKTWTSQNKLNSGPWSEPVTRSMAT